jgi:hypothetical protein
MAGAMVGNPEVSFYTIVSFITYDLPRIDGTQTGIVNNCVSKHSKLHSQDALHNYIHSYGMIAYIPDHNPLHKHHPYPIPNLNT